MQGWAKQFLDLTTHALVAAGASSRFASILAYVVCVLLAALLVDWALLIEIGFITLLLLYGAALGLRDLLGEVSMRFRR